MPGFIILGVIGIEKETRILLAMKFLQSQWSVKCRSRVLDQGQLLCKVSWPI